MGVIEKYRKAKGYSQHDLAKLMGVTQTTVSHWETGKVFPQGKNLLELCRLLDVPALDILNQRGA